MRCRIVCENEVYPWAIGEYIEKFSTTYLKLETLRTILQLYQGNSQIDDSVFIKTMNIKMFKSAKYSPEFVTATQSSIISYEEIKRDKYFLFGKSESPEMFWNIFEKNTRPDVYIREDDKYLPIMQIPSSVLKFNKIEVKSPPLFDLSGAGSTIVDVFYAGEREDRKRVEFQNHMVDQSLSNLNGIIRTEQAIEEATISPGLKAYAKQQLDLLMEKQRIINTQIGAKELQIDEFV